MKHHFHQIFALWEKIWDLDGIGLQKYLKLVVNVNDG